MACMTLAFGVAAPAHKAPLRACAPARAAARRSARVAAFRAVVFAAATDDTLNKVRGIISEQLGLEVDKARRTGKNQFFFHRLTRPGAAQVMADSKFVDLGADSLDTVEIMMALEEQFAITLDEEGAEKISTVKEAADLIQSQLK